MSTHSNTEFSITALVHEVLEEHPDSVDPDFLTTIVVSRIPEEYKDYVLRKTVRPIIMTVWSPSYAVHTKRDDENEDERVTVLIEEGADAGVEGFTKEEEPTMSSVLRGGYLLDQKIKGVHGSVILRDATVEDLRFAEARRMKMAHGMLRWGSYYGRLATALEEHDVKTVGELPPEECNAILAEARDDVQADIEPGGV